MAITMMTTLLELFGVLAAIVLLSSSSSTTSMVVPTATALSVPPPLSTTTTRRGTTQHRRKSNNNNGDLNKRSRRPSQSNYNNKFTKRKIVSSLQNVYDDWRSDAVVDKMYLDEENVEMCLEEFINSDYGQQMFGCHELPASIGITGSIEFVELCGPEVTLHLEGKFWHRRDTVLGRAAMWLNARMPEITDVIVADIDELKDFDEIIDEYSGEVLFRTDRRSPDYNGDREVMEYQGRDPDMRGPFPQGPMGGPAGSMINPV